MLDGNSYIKLEYIFFMDIGHVLLFVKSFWTISFYILFSNIVKFVMGVTLAKVNLYF